MTENDQAFELDERQAQYNQLVEDVKSSYSDIEALNISIVEKQKQIILAKLKNTILRARKPTTLKYNPNPSEGEYEINPEHRVILNNKMNNIKPMYSEIEGYDAKQRELLLALDSIFVDAREENVKKVDLSIQEYEILNSIDEASNRVYILKKHNTETELRIQTLNSLKQEGEAAFLKLRQREVEFEDSLGGRLDCLKEIPNLQAQLYELDTQLKQMKLRIINSNDEEKKRQEEFDKSNQIHNTAVNWVREKEQLLQELKDLKDQIEIQEKGLQDDQKKANSENLKVKRYSQMVQKYKDRFDSIDEPIESINELWEQREMLRSEIESKKHEKESQIAELIAKNTKLSEEINRRRPKPDNLKIIFQTEQNNLKMTNSQDNFKMQEESLLKQIQIARLKLAEKMYL